MSDSDNDTNLVDRTVAFCLIGNYGVFSAALAAEKGVSALYVLLMLFAAVCLGFAMSGPLLRYVVARWMLGAKSDTIDLAYRITPILLHGAAACIVWIVGQIVVIGSPGVGT